MKFTDKKIAEQGQGVWTVSIDGKDWKDAVEKARTKVSENIQVPGFRKGKAPKSEIAKHVTIDKVYDQAFRDLIQPAFKFAMDQKSKIEPMTPPVPSIQKVGPDEVTIDFTFDLKPDIKLGVYKGIKVDKIKAEVTDEEVKEQLENIRQRFAMQTKKGADGKIEKGDVVKFDFKGFQDGKPFAGGEAKDYTLEIGSNQFVPGFEDAMIGLKVGPDQKIKVTFPKEYVKDLAGKDAEFVLNIKEIAKKELPALDDDLAKDINLPDVKTFDDLKKRIKEDILAQKESQSKNMFVDKVIKEIINNSEVDVPKRSVDQEVKQLKKEFEQQVQQQGMTLKDYKKATGMTDKDLDEELESDALLRLQTYLVTSAIREAEKFEVSDKDVDAEYEKYAKQFGVPAEQLKQMLPAQRIKDELVNQKLIDFLWENNGK